MASDEQQGTPGMVPGLVESFMAQLRVITAGLEAVAGSAARRHRRPAAFPLPGALSAAQLSAIAASVAAQRRSIGALQAQLSAFDEQLAMLEQILGPLAEWSGTWAELEQRLMNMPRPPGSPGGSVAGPGE